MFVIFRDKISHGEIDHTSITTVLIDRTLSAFFYLLHKYADESELQQIPPEFEKNILFVDSYISCFHPKSLFQRSLFDLFQKIDQLKEIVNSYPYREDFEVDKIQSELNLD